MSCRWLPRRSAPALLLGLAATAGTADGQVRSERQWAEFQAPDGPQSRARGSAEDYFRDNPWCANLTDGCLICLRESERIQCSTPGIACLQGEYSCTWPAREPDH